MSDGLKKVVATVYPFNGKPRVLELELFANSRGTQDYLFPIIELAAGEHQAQDLVRDLPESGWLTYKCLAWMHYCWRCTIQKPRTLEN